MHDKPLAPENRRQECGGFVLGREMTLPEAKEELLGIDSSLVVNARRRLNGRTTRNIRERISVLRIPGY